jgi:hypothetical protein
MRWTGTGSGLWRVRVDLFADDDDRRRVATAFDALDALLTRSDDNDPKHDFGVDQGTSIAKRPVVGLTFWLAADDVAAAAANAVAVARQAGEGCGVGPELYDVVVVPQASVAEPSDHNYPPRPD